MRNNCTHYKNCKTKSALELMTPDCDLTMTTTNLFLWPHEQSLAVKKRKSRKQIRLKKGFSLIVLILVTCVSTIGVLRSLVIISFLREDGRLKNLGGGDEKIKRLLKENVLFLVLQKSGGVHLPLRPLVPPALFLLQLLSVGVFFCHFGNCLSTHFVTRLLR